jgi:hypothetical protein
VPETPVVIFERFASLLLPADERLAARAIAAGEWWQLDRSELHSLDAAVWGRAPLSSDTPVATAARSAIARERSMLRLRRPSSSQNLRMVDSHRWHPPALDRGKTRQAMKAALYGGALVELGTGARFNRVVDQVCLDAGLGPRLRSFDAGSGGSLRSKVRSPTGEAALLRAGKAGTPAAPSKAGEALAHLSEHRLPNVPGLLARSESAGAAWTVETLLPGCPPRRLGRRLADEVLTFCRMLPHSAAPITAFSTHLETIANHLPKRKAEIARVTSHVGEVIDGLPAVTCHGDMWVGNLLEQRDALTGVLDWDAWHPAGVPGTDLVQLFATDEMSHTKKSLGECWSTKPWLREPCRSFMGPYWKSAGAKPTTEVWDAVGTAWWAGQIANSLLRLPHLALRPSWVALNVDIVIEALS